MQPFATLLTIDKAGQQPVYLQIAGRLTSLIIDGTLKPGYRLSSTRQLAELLSVHRKTVVRAYDELLAQGWLESQTGSGTYVARHLPENKPQRLGAGAAGERADRVRAAGPQADGSRAAGAQADAAGWRADGVRAAGPLPAGPAQIAGFAFEAAPHLDREDVYYPFTYHLDDGFPDARLAPLNDLARAYRAQLLTGRPYNRLGYGDPRGASLLREVLSPYLNETRGLKTTAENLLIVRGTMMGLYLISMGLIRPGDLVVTGETTYSGAVTNLTHAGARLVRIGVDEHGMQVDELDRLCSRHPVRLVYITSHHHYPTTVALRPDRRLQLLRLSEKYGFIILEDDYDYDFHYLNKPHLPLAAADQAGMVLYCGSFTKAISPGIRVGYLAGSENVIRHLGKLRRFIDRQGDTLLENAMAALLQNGIVQRHLRKTLRVYRERRNAFCGLLQSEMGNYVNFQVPEGGMAVWTRFDTGIDLAGLAARAIKKDLYFSNGQIHNLPEKNWNATRLGFASASIPELEKSVEILLKLLKEPG